MERRARPRSAASSRRRGEPRPAGLGVVGQRRHRHQPADAHRAALQEGIELLRRNAALVLLARQVDLDQHLRLAAVPWRSSWARTESLATEWIRRTCGSTSLTLRL